MSTAIWYAVVSLLAIFALSLWPPAQGEMIVYYPFDKGPHNGLNRLFATQARLINQGPIEGSWIIWADTPEISKQLAAGGGLLLDAAGFQGCAGQATTRETMASQGHMLGDGQ